MLTACCCSTSKASEPVLHHTKQIMFDSVVFITCRLPWFLWAMHCSQKLYDLWSGLVTTAGLATETCILLVQKGEYQVDLQILGGDLYDSLHVYILAGSQCGNGIAVTLYHEPPLLSKPLGRENYVLSSLRISGICDLTCFIE